MKPDAARALASALPADLSHSPLLGILAVNMGAGIATLGARFLSLALADLRGHFGIGVDEGAWIGTAFNAATMFSWSAAPSSPASRRRFRSHTAIRC
jgi:hypothetical protein